jgi:hypothetical protein
LTNILSVDGRMLKKWDRLDEIKQTYDDVARGRNPKYEDMMWIVEPGDVEASLMESVSQIT